jgi:site-specific DNA-cytosine methylase
MGVSERTCLTLFSGGGLADVGLRAAGYTPVGAVEYDAAIAGVYALNHGDHVHVAPVQDVDYRPYAGVTLVWASPVCTRASVANQDGEECAEDHEAADAVIRCLSEVRPVFFCLENVWPYRHFDSFKRICDALTEQGYRFVFEHLNAANYGVAQTRKRLILRARRDDGPLALMVPTHSCTASLFTDPWVGWYEAVEDLIPTLPESRFAEWQMKRLPEALKTFLVGGSNTSDAQAGPGVGGYADTEPTRCIVPSADRWRAFLAHPTADNDRFPVVIGSDPAFTTTCFRGMPRGFIVDGKPANYAGDLRIEASGRDAPTITASQPQHPFRALLVDGQNSRGQEGRDTTLLPTEPAMTLSAAAVKGPPRAWLEHGRVVQMTPRALARFQSAPDTYQLPQSNKLACRVIGNGVPSLLAQRVAESFG